MLHQVWVQGYIVLVKSYGSYADKICITLRFVYLLQKQQIGHCSEAIHNQNLMWLQNPNLTNLSHRQ